MKNKTRLHFIRRKIIRFSIKTILSKLSMMHGFRLLFSYDSIYLPIFIYGFVKQLCFRNKKTTNTFYRIFIHVFQIFLTLVVLPILFFILFVFTCYFESITILAKLYFGKAFQDNIIQADVPFTFKFPKSNNIVHAIQFLTDVANTPETMLTMFRNPEIMDQVMRNHPRFSCLRKPFLGYIFYVKIDIDYTKIMRYLEDYNTLEEFNELISRISNTDMPYNDESMWEVLIGRKKIEVHPGKFCYPVVHRVHHSAGDGMSLISFLLTCFAKNGVERFSDQCRKYNKIFKKQQKPKEAFKFEKFFNNCLALLNMDIYYHFDFFFSKEEPNILHTQLTGEKIVTYSFEPPGEKLMEKIKKTKNNLKVSFSDIVISAVSATVLAFYKKRMCNPLTEITSFNPYFHNPEKIEHMLTIHKNGKPVIKLGNTLTISMAKLPVDVNLLENPLDIISRVNQETQSIKKSLDFKMFAWLYKVFSTFAPRFLIDSATNRIDATVLITILPGLDEFTFSNDCFVEDMVYWAQNFREMGVTFSFMTFRSCLRLVMNVDRGIIDNVAEVQELGDAVLRNINVFYEQSSNAKCN